jgi:alpha-galactosidase
VGFARVDELRHDPRRAADVYAEGWQTWSPFRLLRLGEASERAASDRDQTVLFRPGKPVPPGVVQAEGVLAIGPPDGPAVAWFAPHPAREVPTLRVELKGDRALVTADGEVGRLEAPDLPSALAAVGRRMRAPAVRTVPTGWCSWSQYFKHVTEADVIENVEAARLLDLPIDVIQVDDGYESVIGDWLDVDRRFGSLRRAAEAIRGAGMIAGIWLPPFMVDPRSNLAAQHPDWLVAGADAGVHWDVTMRILDLTNRDAAAHLRAVLQTFLGWGFTFFKLDFLYAGAIVGLDHYREGMSLIRDTVGPDAVLLVGGAPLLPSVGLCDAMRVGPDVLPEVDDPQPDVERLKRITSLRSWMNGTLWVNDPDHIVARPGIRHREEWARYVEGYGGVRFSGDRLGELDELGVELTRRTPHGRADDALAISWTGRLILSAAAVPPATILSSTRIASPPTS